MPLITDLSGILLRDYLGMASPVYDVSGEKSCFLNKHRVPEGTESRGSILLPLHPRHGVSVADSIASCLLATCEGQDVLEGDEWTWEFNRRDVPAGSVLMSPQTFMMTGEILTNRTFVHQSVPHGLAVFCGMPDFVGVVCYEGDELKFGVLVKKNGVVPALVLKSTDVDLARLRVMDILDVMET